MSFLQLPTELKLNIIERLDPQSSLHFALTDRHHSKLCQNILREHARLFAEYSTLEATGSEKSLWTALVEILQDPRKGWYARELNLTNYRNDDTNLPRSEKDLSLYKAAAEDLVPLYPRELTFFATERDGDVELFGDDWDNLVEACTEEVIIILLIHHLPQLRTFRMTVDSGIAGFLEMFMRRIAAGYQDPVSAPRMPLQHLKVAAIAHWDSEGYCSVDWAVYFLCVPSLRTFAGLSMGSDGVKDDTNSEAYLHAVTQTPVSNVEELDFTNCRFDAQSLHTILPLTKNLKRFSYEAGGHTVSFSDLEPRKVLHALVTHTSNSLEEFELTETTGLEDFDDSDLAFVSLRSFKMLRALHCESHWLVSSQDTDLDDDDEALSQGFHSTDDTEIAVADPRDNLPESLEELHLFGIYEDEEWKRLTRIFETANPSTPKLTYEKTCLIRGGSNWNSRGIQEKIGGAAKPGEDFCNTLDTEIWIGHGY